MSEQPEKPAFSRNLKAVWYLWAIALWLAAMVWLLKEDLSLCWIGVAWFLVGVAIFTHLRWARLLITGLGVVAMLFLGLDLATSGPGMGPMQVGKASIKGWMYFFPCWMIVGAFLGVFGGKLIKARKRKKRENRDQAQGVCDDEGIARRLALAQRRDARLKDALKTLPPGSPEYWDRKYELELEDEFFRQHWQERRIDILEEYLDQYPPGSLSILCPGCGISAVPKILQLYGHKVIACDQSRVAVEFAKSHTLSVEEIAAYYCLLVDDEPAPGSSMKSRHFERDTVMRLAALKKRCRAGGSLEYRVCDWLSVSEQDFDLIYCEHAFKQADKELVHKSMLRFASQLKPTGLLFAIEVNDWNFVAIPVAKELGMLIGCRGGLLPPGDKLVFPPTQKSAMFVHCTG